MIAYSVDMILEALLSSALEQTLAERGVVLLLEGTASERSHARGFDDPALEERKAYFSRTVVEEVRTTGTGRVIVDDGDEFGTTESVRGLGLRSVVAAPLRVEEGILGVLCLDNRLKTGAFNYEDLDRLTGLCRLAAMAIHNARVLQAEGAVGR